MAATFTKETRKSGDFAKGGKTHMFGQQSAEKSEAGQTADTTAVDKPGDKYACGGSTKMFGYAGVQSAKAGITSAR